MRASLGGPFTSAPLLCVPYSASRTFTDDEYIWYVNQRLGKTQPSTFQANPKGDAVCSCAARKLIADGHHLRVCRMGGGHITVHNILRDVIHSMCANAGVVAQTEVPDMLHDGNERPGDIVATGIGRDGEDICIDACVMDPLAGLAALTLLMRQRRTWHVAHSAIMAEKFKKNKKRTGEPNGQTMEQRVRAIGKTFYPVGFEVFGATTASCYKLIKLLSEKAHDRRGTTRQHSFGNGQRRSPCVWRSGGRRWRSLAHLVSRRRITSGLTSEAKRMDRWALPTRSNSSALRRSSVGGRRRL